MGGRAHFVGMRYFIVLAIVLAGCSQSDFQKFDAAFDDYTPTSERADPDPWPRHERVSIPQRTPIWCRELAYGGGMVCS